MTNFKKFFRKPFKRAFTLIEVLVVISIISILSSGMFLTIKTQLSNAHDKQRIEDLKAIAQALDLYRKDKLDYPPQKSNPAVEYVSNGSPSWIPDLTNYVKLPSDPKQVSSVFKQMFASLFQKVPSVHLADSSMSSNPQGEVSGISSATFGNTTIGSYVDTSANNAYDGSRFVMGPDGGTATSISVYVSSPIDKNHYNNYQLVIYSDNAGSPGVKIANTSQGTLTGNAWNTLAISATLTPNTAYWLMYNTNASLDADNNLNYNTGNNGDGGYFATPFGTFPSNPTSTLEARVYSIYVTYTPNPYITLNGSSSCSGSSSIVHLSWTTNASYSVYNIIRDGSPITSTTSTSWNSAPNADQGVNHTWQVQGDPSSGGAFSNTVDVTNASCATYQTTLSGSSICDGTNSKVHLVWNTNAGDTQFNILYDGTAITSTIGTTWDSGPNTPGETHNWQVQGTSSGTVSNTVTVTNGTCSVSVCQNAGFAYCYITNADRNSYVLWARLENEKSPLINTQPSADCRLTAPTNTQFNYCLKSPEQ